jgi:hypothetical protein
MKRRPDERGGRREFIAHAGRLRPCIVITAAERADM